VSNIADVEAWVFYGMQYIDPETGGLLMQQGQDWNKYTLW